VQISVVLAPEVPAELALEGHSCVVIDVLRATTSMVAALDAGVKGIYPVADPEDAWALQQRLAEDMVLGGERGGLKISGFDLGNSPREYMSATVGGRFLAMTTTNGTRALLEAAKAGADPIYIAALRNAPAVAKRLLREQRPTVLYCAGTHGLVSLDDVLAAGAVISACVDTSGDVALADSARLAMLAYRSERRDLGEALRATQHGAKLVALGFGTDLDFAAQVGASTAVGQFDGVMVRLAGHVLRRPG